MFCPIERWLFCEMKFFMFLTPLHPPRSHPIFVLVRLPRVLIGLPGFTSNLPVKSFWFDTLIWNHSYGLFQYDLFFGKCFDVIVAQMVNKHLSKLKDHCSLKKKGDIYPLHYIVCRNIFTKLTCIRIIIFIVVNLSKCYSTNVTWTLRCKRWRLFSPLNLRELNCRTYHPLAIRFYGNFFLPFTLNNSDR